MHAPTPVEDINAVIDRFQAWAGAQAANKPKDGVRELSYEEALKTSRYRHAAYASLPGLPEKPEAAKTKVQLSKSQTAEPVKTGTTGPSQHDRKAKKKTSVGRTVSKPSIEPARQEFRQVLAESLAVLPAKNRTSLAIAPRKASLSVRVSASELAFIKTRASEANVSVSAYLRQCALEVEQLRAQVEQAITTMPQRKALLQSTPPPASAQIQGLLARLARRLLGSRILGLRV